MIPVVSGTRVL